MESVEDLFFFEDLDEMYWMVITFHAAQPEAKRELLDHFSYIDPPFPESHSMDYLKLKALGYCTFSVPDALPDRAKEFGERLSDQMFNATCESNQRDIWNTKALDNEFWSQARLLAVAILEAWGIGSFPFDGLKDKICLNYIGPEPGANPDW